MIPGLSSPGPPSHRVYSLVVRTSDWERIEKLNSHEALNGVSLFNKTPLAPTHGNIWYHDKSESPQFRFTSIPKHLRGLGSLAKIIPTAEYQTYSCILVITTDKTGPMWLIRVSDWELRNRCCNWVINPIFKLVDSHMETHGDLLQAVTIEIEPLVGTENIFPPPPPPR